MTTTRSAGLGRFERRLLVELKAVLYEGDEPTADGTPVLRSPRLPSSKRRQSFRRPVVVIALVAVVAAVAVAAAVMPRTRTPVQPLDVGCATALQRDWSGSVVQLAPGTDPEAACAADARFSGRAGPAKTVTCVLPGQVAVVFPNPTSMSAADACASIGASLPAEGRYGNATDNQVRAWNADLQRKLEALPGVAGCWSPEVVKPTVDQVIAEHRLTGWSVRDSSGAARHVDVLVDVQAATVSIQPATRDC